MTRTGRVYTPKETREYETMIREAWLLLNPGLTFTKDVDVLLEFTFKRPKSHHNSKGMLKPDAPKHHTQTPDLDNIEKAVLDGLNKVAYTDDKQIVMKHSTKRWGNMDVVLVVIRGIVTGLQP